MAVIVAVDQPLYREAPEINELAAGGHLVGGLAIAVAKPAIRVSGAAGSSAMPTSSGRTAAMRSSGLPAKE